MLSHGGLFRLLPTFWPRRGFHVSPSTISLSLLASCCCFKLKQLLVLLLPPLATTPRTEREEDGDSKLIKHVDPVVTLVWLVDASN
jgi:hypothetical protein